MKTFIRNLLFISFLVTFSSSCVNVKNKKEIKEIPLSIIVTEKIGNVAGDNLPLEIDSLFNPIEPLNCPKVAFLPKVEIVRYGFPNEYHKVIKTDGSGWKTFFQKFYGNTGVETQKSNIKKALEEIVLGDSLVMMSEVNLPLNQIFEKVFTSNPSSQFYILNSELNSTTYKLANSEIAVFNNVKSLLTVLGNQLCDKQAKASQKIVVFYNPQMDIQIDSIPILYLNVIPQHENVKKEAGNLFFKVSSNIDWQVKSTQSWCIPDVTNGNGNDSLITKYEENKSSVERSVELLFTGTGVSKQIITITQKGRDEEPPPLPKSLEEYFQIIADKSIDYKRKGKLKKDVIIKYFENEDVQVIERGDNGNEVSRTSIKDYVEVLSLQYYKIKILDKKIDENKKITTLYIKEL